VLGFSFRFEGIYLRCVGFLLYFGICVWVRV